MKDKLKDFINQRRDEFDDREPSDRVWSAIQKDIFGKGGRSIFSSLSVWRAAAVIFFGLSVYLFTANSYSEKKSEKKEVWNLQGELKDLESFYGDQIAEKAAFIDKLDGYEDDLFTQDVQKLDAMYEVLREEMRTSPSEKVKDALILNMLIRIDLLNQQIKKLEDSRKRNDGKKEI